MPELPARRPLHPRPEGPGRRAIRPIFHALAVPALVCVALACPPSATHAVAASLVPDLRPVGFSGPDSLPRRPLLFEDGSTSLNDRCPVRASSLNPDVFTVFVNGRPIGFC